MADVRVRSVRFRPRCFHTVESSYKAAEFLGHVAMFYNCGFARSRDDLNGHAWIAFYA